MDQQPFRTGTTWLTDYQLVLLDVLFNVGVAFDSLRRDTFLEEWNLGYAHALDDAALASDLRRLCERGVLDTDADRPWFRMTAAGGELWSLERLPVWERFVTGRHRGTGRGHATQAVVAGSGAVRDDFLALFPHPPVLVRTAVMDSPRLLDWRDFPRGYAGVVMYRTPPVLAGGAARREMAEWPGRVARQERERTWWWDVRQLQRFVPYERRAEQVSAPPPSDE
jgi:hypothetical protein